MKKSIIVLLSLLALAACKYQEGDTQVIDKPEIEVKDGHLSPEILWAMGRLTEVSVSPDGKYIVFGIRYFDLKANKGNTDLYRMDVDGKHLKRLTRTDASEYNLTWRPDGEKIAFCRGGQIWEMDSDGKNTTQISSFDFDVQGFSYAPQSDQILYIRNLPVAPTAPKLFEGLEQTSARVIEDLNYRHWDHWVEDYPHPFVAKLENGRLTEGVDLLQGEPFECPMRPFGGIEQLDWSPDGSKIVYTCRKKTGVAYAYSTNSDIYLYDLNTRQVTNISEGMMGYDQNPRFSPDGNMIAWESMERDGYEADQIRLFTYDLNTGEKEYRSEQYDSDCRSLLWSRDGKAIYFISPWQGTENIYRLTLADNSVKAITEGLHDYTGLAWAGETLIAPRMSMSAPSEIYRVSIDGQQEAISQINTDLIAKLKFGKVSHEWITCTDGAKMLVSIIYPSNFDPNKKYPTLLYCQGGPQSMVSQFWSYRWNFQIMAANDYIIVAPNRRGLPGFGKAWCEQISGDYSGQNMRDYFSAIDYAAKLPNVDADRLGCVGASYGGFSVYWMAGNHNKRFKAFIAHNGIFNLEQQSLETEEKWFAQWDMGCYWEPQKNNAAKTFANSPHKFVDRWDTPIMVIHSELDYRIVASQGMAAFNAAQMRGIPSRYLYFPDENHWVLKPQNGVLWQRCFFDWLDTYLKDPNTVVKK